MTINPIDVAFFDVSFNGITFDMSVSKIDNVVPGKSMITIYSGSYIVEDIIGCNPFYITVHDNHFHPDMYVEAGYAEEKLELLKIIFSAIHKIYYESMDNSTD
jgi:hypothetical protein